MNGPFTNLFEGVTNMRRPLKVLLVEDRVDVRVSTSELLRAVGSGMVTTEMVGSLKDAFALLENTPFSVVLLDLTLPDAKGTEAVDRFQDKHPEVPVVVFSGDKNPDTATNCLHAGAMDYIHKGDDPANMLERIRHAVVLHDVRKSFSRLETAQSKARDNIAEMQDVMTRMTTSSRTKS